MGSNSLPLAVGCANLSYKNFNYHDHGFSGFISGLCKYLQNSYTMSVHLMLQQLTREVVFPLIPKS